MICCVTSPDWLSQPANRVQRELAPTKINWGNFLMLSESRPVRKMIWQKKKKFPKPLKILYVDVHEILSSITKYIKAQT